MTVAAATAILSRTSHSVARSIFGDTMPKLLAANQLRATLTIDKNRDRDMWSIGTTLAEWGVIAVGYFARIPWSRRSGAAAITSARGIAPDRRTIAEEE